MPATLKYSPAFVPEPVPASNTSVVRLGVGVVLAALLFSVTVWNSECYNLLDAGWQWVRAALTTSQQGPDLRQPSGGITQLMHHAHSVPAVLIFGVLYVGLCLALQWILLAQPAQRRLVGWFYGGCCGVVLCLLGASQLSGSAALMALNKQLVHFVVSPLPVIVLVPLLRWYMPTQSRPLHA